MDTQRPAPAAPSPSAAVESAAEAALCRGFLYGVLSIGLGEPNPAVVACLRGADTRRAVEDAARLLESRSIAAGPVQTESSARHPRDGDVALVRRAAAVVRQLGRLDVEALRAAHGELFGHTTRGRVCPYECEYGPDAPAAIFQQAQRLADVTGFYAAFGLEPAPECRERPDHIRCELEFMDFLARKETYALQVGDAAMLDATREGARRFLRDHLGRFGRACALVLAAEDPGGFHGDLGDLLYDFLTLECARQRVSPGPAVLRLRSTQDDGLPMLCEPACDPTACPLPEARS